MTKIIGTHTQYKHALHLFGPMVRLSRTLGCKVGAATERRAVERVWDGKEECVCVCACAGKCVCVCVCCVSV